MCLLTNRRRRPASRGALRARRLRIDQLESRRLLNAGDLDPDFGADGLVLSDFADPGFSVDAGNAVAVDFDGKILVAGSKDGDFAIARYNPDGTLDPSFGAGGLVTIDFGGSTDAAAAIAIDLTYPGVDLPPGVRSIVVAGTAGDDFAVARLDRSTGALDPSFGVGGKVVTDVSIGSVDEVFDVAPERFSDRVVVAGSSNGNTVLVQYQPNGQIQSQFGDSGFIITDFLGGSPVRLINFSDRFTIVGQTGTDIGLASFHDNGDVDSNFGVGGRVVTDFGGAETARGITLHPDGRLVVVGTSDGDIALARYNLNGSLDTSFGGDGRVLTDIGPGVMPAGVAVQPDGRPVVAGSSAGDFFLVRYDVNGALDASFGTGGIVTTDFGGNDLASGIDVRADGRIVVAGTSNADVAVARYFAADATGLQETIGLYNRDSASFLLSTDNAPGPAEIVFQYGSPELLPIAGDWNGDGVATAGGYHLPSSTFFLRNSNSPGFADIVFQFGEAGRDFIPIAGDWDGDGIDTVGLYRPEHSTFAVRHSNSQDSTATLIAFGFTTPDLSNRPVVGNWDGVGGDSIGIYANFTFFLSNKVDVGPADLMIGYGPQRSGLVPMGGDWTGVGAAGVGIYEPATGAVFLRNLASGGPADIHFVYGAAGQNYLPVTGDWNGPVGVLSPAEPQPGASHRRPPNAAVLETLFSAEEDWLV